jgi:ABC-type iron transport system FetAB ATPase subunit
LWPLHCGVLTKPFKEDILFIPQKPYLVLGNLRDQIIYPHTKEQMEAIGVSDTDLEHLLEIVDPAKLITKTWSWDTEKDWFHAFSGGQKRKFFEFFIFLERVAMARLFYHRPKYAILDECTSAVSDEVEDKIYETCGELGITIFTVSHRKSLARHHKWILNLDGRGGYKFYPHEATPKQIIIKSTLASKIIIPENITLQDFVLNKAKQYGDEPAFIDYDSKFTLSFNQVISMSDDFAKNLHFGCKTKKGDVVGMYLPNDPLVAVILYGTLKAGCVLTTLNPLYTESEVNKQLVDSNTSWLITIPSCLETAKKGSLKTNVKTIYVLSSEAVIEEEFEGIQITNLSNLLSPTQWKEEIVVKFDPKEDVAILPYSSGTTGVSKGVHYHFIHILGDAHSHKYCCKHYSRRS